MLRYLKQGHLLQGILAYILMDRNTLADQNTMSTTSSFVRIIGSDQRIGALL